ncbi:MAG: preprotein translocase subunit SecG [Balneolales bacterium]|nr:preprotein translocase subunit SecG [Balneolales bacterium]
MLIYNIIIVVITIICALLILVVLLQNGQGEGLAGIGGGGGLDGGAGLGARRTADLLSKSTSILGGVFLVLCIMANFAIDRQQAEGSILQQGSPIENFNAPSSTQSAVPSTTLPPVNNDGDTGSDDTEN